MRRVSATSLSFLIFGMVFLYIPIFFLIFFSFSESSIPGIWTEFSLKWFKEVFSDTDLARAALTSFEIAFISATGSTFLGLVAAIATTRQGNFMGKSFLSGSISMPIVMPEIITGFSLLMLFIAIEKCTGISVKKGAVTVTIGHIMISMAYVHMTISARLSNFEQSFEEAALNLGAHPIKVFLYITIPVISKSVLAGWLLAFTLSLDDLVVASFLSGPGTTTLPVLIFSNVRIGISPAINAFSTIFIGVVSICLISVYMISKNKK